MTPTVWLAPAALTISLGRLPHVVPSSAYAHELGYRTVTATTYEGVPLASHDAVRRAKALTDLARCCDGERHPGATFADAVAGKTLTGKRQGQNMAPYDWQRDGVRVACKSAQLKWDSHKANWMLQFRTVKLQREGAPEAAFDELLLALYTPEGVHLFEHDLRAGVSTAGKSTAATGQHIKFYGPRHEEDWRAALVVVLEKMGVKGCSQLAFVPWDRGST